MSEPKMPRTIAVDFDNTLFETDWPDIKKPIWPAINAARTAKEEGAELILWTTREGGYLTAALEACENVGLTFDAVNDNTETMKKLWGNDPRKVGATEYWDDRAVNLMCSAPQLPSCYDRIQQEDNDTLRRLLCGEWVDSKLVERALGLTFAECMKRFELSRTASWNPPPQNGQKVETKFRLRVPPITENAGTAIPVQMRPCGGGWEYCNGQCTACPKLQSYHTRTTTEGAI